MSSNPKGKAQLFEIYGGELIAATSRRNAGRLVREKYGIKRSYPLKKLSPHKQIKMSENGSDDFYMLSAREVAGQFCPGIVPQGD